MPKSLFFSRKIFSLDCKYFFADLRYIYNSQGIILLVDPLQIPQVREQLKSKGVKLPNENAETEDIVDRVTNLIRTALGLTNRKKLIKTPIAIVFSKIDALEEILKDNPELFSSGNHNGFYNLEDANNIKLLIESCMKEWKSTNFINSVKLNFKTYSFFGISALGSNPHGSNTIPKLRPTRVEDPFLWLLCKNGIIKGKPTWLDNQVESIKSKIS
jgi:hypothetical protein